MIITPEATQHTPLQMIDFYKKSFNVVHAITCSKCKNTISLELSDPMTNDLLGLKTNQLGLVVLPVDQRLLASRIRLDGMMGYQCICGNDTRASEIEEYYSPTGDFHPHEAAAIIQHFAEVSWKAPIKHKNGKEHRGTFVAERV